VCYTSLTDIKNPPETISQRWEVILCLRDDSVLTYAGRRDQKMIQPNPNPNPATNSCATIRIRYLFGTENTPDHLLFFIKSSQSILRIPTVEESMMISNARTTTQTAQHPTSYDRTHIPSPSLPPPSHNRPTIYQTEHKSSCTQRHSANRLRISQNQRVFLTQPLSPQTTKPANPVSIFAGLQNATNN
jgi:hypothetical protein